MLCEFLRARRASVANLSQKTPAIEVRRDHDFGFLGTRNPSGVKLSFFEVSPHEFDD
jgi:hypothetical protein